MFFVVKKVSQFEGTNYIYYFWIYIALGKRKKGKYHGRYYYFQKAKTNKWTNKKIIQITIYFGIS